MEAQRLDSCRRDPLLIFRRADGQHQRHLYITAPRAAEHGEEPSRLTISTHPDVKLEINGGVPEPAFNIEFVTDTEELLEEDEMLLVLELALHRADQPITLELRAVGQPGRRSTDIRKLNLLRETSTTYSAMTLWT